MRSLCFGAILWDVIEGEEHLGGAPYNLAVHLRRLGFESYMASSIGDDKRGDRIQAAMLDHSIVGRWVKRDPDHPTAVVTVTVDECGESSYEICEGVASDHIDLTPEEVTKLSEIGFDFVCYGSLEQRGNTTRRSLYRLLHGLSESETRTFCDLNLRQRYYNKEVVRDSLAYCDILKLNDDEAAITGKLLFPGRTFTPDGRSFCAAVSQMFDVKLVIITRGSDGCSVFTEGEMIDVAGQTVEVVDTVGPGDAFSAAFLHEYLTTGNPVGAAAKANQLGAYVASKRGALPDYDNEIKREMGLGRDPQ